MKRSLNSTDMKQNLKLKTIINQTQKKENKIQNKKETKEKKENKSKTSSLSLQPPQMPTQTLLYLERIKSGETELSLDNVVKLENIPQLMNQIHVPVPKMPPKNRLEYLRTLKLEKTQNQVKDKTQKMNNPKYQINIANQYKLDPVKFKILSGLSVDSFVQLVHLLECQIVKFTGDMNIRNCKFERGSLSNIDKMNYKYKMEVESTIFIFLVFIRTGLDFTKLFALLNLESVSPHTFQIGETNEKFIERNKSRMSKFVKGYITTFLRRYTIKFQNDFINQVSSCAALNIPLAVGMKLNDILICPELLYSYRIIDSRTVQCTTQWSIKKNKKGNNVKTKNTDLYSEKVNGSGFKYEIQINKLCFITHVVSTFGKTSDINLSKIGDAGTFNFGLTIGDSGYNQKDYHGIITPLKKNCVKNEEDKNNRNIFNSTITQARNSIEQVFGNMSTLFGILKTNFSENKSLFHSIIICICGLYNYYLIQGPIRNDLMSNKENRHLIETIDIDSLLENNYKQLSSKCNVIENLHISQTQQQTQNESQSQTPYSTFGYNKGISQPFQQLEQILLKSQSQQNFRRNSNEMELSKNILDVDKCDNSKLKMKNVYSRNNGISISKEEMLQLKNGEFIESIIVNYILKKSIQNKNIYVFETLEPQIISKENDSSVRNTFQEAMLYPIWFVPFNDNNHFTLFIVHTIHQNNSFEQSCILYFNSLPSFQSDINGHINIIKRISNCIGCKFNETINKINVPEQKNNDCGCCICYFAEKYSINMPKTIHETNILFSGLNIKSEMDNERRKMILSINEDRYFESQI